MTSGTFIKDFLNNGLEPDSVEDGSTVTNMPHLMLCTLLTCLNKKCAEKDFKDKPGEKKMTGPIKSAGKKILEYIWFSGFRESWQNFKKEGGETLLALAEDLI
jgi:hypothetical protein